MTLSADLPALRRPTSDYFANFAQHSRTVPNWVWRVARIVVLGYSLTLIALLILRPELGLTLFWGVTIPALPMILVVAPGLWRQVCPMAFLNYLPRRFGFSRLLTLPDRWRDASFGVAVLGFVVAVSLRHPILNHNGPVLAGLLVAVLVAAFVGGVTFKGRSGWCGTFCPLGPIQRTYGQAPLVVVSNGLCESCVGCQKNCYDFSPRTAVYSDILSDNPRHAAQRRLFWGLLPGLILGYFLQGTSQDYGTATYLAVLYGSCCLSVGIYWILDSFVPIEPYRLSLGFGAFALAAFYWFAGPVMVTNLDKLLGLVPSQDTLSAAHGIAAVAALLLVGSGLASHAKFRRRTAAKASVAPQSAPTRIAPAATGVTDRATGTQFNVPEGKSLLDAVESAGLKISSSCRSGLCGADAVAICEGMENLDPPGPEELATLRRMGLEGKARLACMCKVNGPVTIDRDPNAAAIAPEAAPQTTAAPVGDPAPGLGLNRIVIVGNGVAGMTAAQAIRLQSPSVAIDIVTSEVEHFYNRMAIGKLLYQASGMDGMQMVGEPWFEQNRVTVHRNTVATRIDRAGSRLGLATGEWLPYDRLILATGARAAVPDPQFLAHRNAFVMRTAEDANAIRAFVQTNGAKRAVVIGGGVLGVEAAEALNRLGLHVALIQRSDRLMNAQLDPDTAAYLADHLDRFGIRVATNASISHFETDDDLIRAAWLSHGPTLRADVYLACLGNQPNSFLARQAGLKCRRGILVDDLMRTSDPAILAIGDVAETRTGMPGLWPMGTAQAEAAVATVFGRTAPYKPPQTILRLKSDTIDVCAFGSVTAKPGDEILAAPANDPARWRIVCRQGRVVGATFAGAPGTARDFAEAISKGDLPTCALSQVEDRIRQQRSAA